MSDEDQHSLSVDVTNLQPLCFSSTHTGGIQSCQQGAMLQIVRRV
jgi:hypothetical protein